MLVCFVAAAAAASAAAATAAEEELVHARMSVREQICRVFSFSEGNWPPRWTAYVWQGSQHVQQLWEGTARIRLPLLRWTAVSCEPWKIL
jgi:hypothetical protein